MLIITNLVKSVSALFSNAIMCDRLKHFSTVSQYYFQYCSDVLCPVFRRVTKQSCWKSFILKFIYNGNCEKSRKFFKNVKIAK